MSIYWQSLLFIALVSSIAALILFLWHRASTRRILREEEKRISSERLFHSYLDSVPDGIAITDEKGVILSASTVLLKMFCFENEDQMAGRNIADFLIPADRDAFLRNLTEQLGGSPSGFNQYQALRSDGTTFFEETTFKWVERFESGDRAAFMIIHDVTEHKLIEESESRARKTAEALQAIGLVINSTLDYSQMLNLVLEQIGRVLTFDVASILMKDGDEIFITAVRGFDNPDEIILKRFNLIDESPNILVLNQRKPVIVTSVQEEFPSFQKGVSRMIQSWMGIPLFSRDEIIGFLNLDSEQPDHFSDYDKMTAEAFANQVAIALENAHLYTESQRRLKEQAIQNEIARSISLKLDSQEFYDMLYQQIGRFIDIGIFVIANYETGAETWETVYYRKKDRVLEPFTSKLEEGLSGYVLQNRAPLFLSNSAMVDEFTRKSGYSSLISTPKSIMIIPLIVSDRILGALGAQNDEKENAYSQEDFNLFSSIGSQIAAAFENIRLFSRMEQLAIMDNLTNIYNRRHFFDLAHREFDRAERYDRPFSVIMADIDHFKKVNDTYGHTAGDLTLQAFARLIQQTIRHVDVLGRYGGEEFAIVLPETNLEQARSAAERLRRKVSEFEIVTSRGAVHLTISIGISTRSTPGESLEDLIDRSDRGLYAAKNAGRNRVEAVD
ncbi:MAG: diguanylate cyclase [Anaerolineaceae bacterium]